MNSRFKGAGAPRQRKVGPIFRLRETMGLEDVEKRITPFTIKKGESKTVIVLDRGELNFSRMIHNRFYGNDTLDNVAVCRRDEDNQGCPICDLGDRAQWYALMTVLDTTPWKPQDRDETLSHFRRLVLIPAKAISDFEKLSSDEHLQINGNWRGMKMRVGRSEDKMAARIGTSWTPIGRVTDDEILDACDLMAEVAKVPVESYVEPIDYEYDLAPYSAQFMDEAINEVAGDAGPDSPGARRMKAAFADKDGAGGGRSGGGGRRGGRQPQRSSGGASRRSAPFGAAGRQQPARRPRDEGRANEDIIEEEARNAESGGRRRRDSFDPPAREPREPREPRGDNFGQRYDDRSQRTPEPTRKPSERALGRQDDEHDDDIPF